LPSYSSPALPALFDGVHQSIHSVQEYMQFGDFDGDGKTDYMWIPYNGDGRWVIAYGTDNGFSIPSYDNPALPATISGGYQTVHGATQYVRFGDFNGDGKTDYMWVPNNGDGRWLIAYGIANPTHTGPAFTVPDYNNPALPAYFDGVHQSIHSAVQEMQIGDFNGDGKADYMWAPYNGD